MADSRRKTGGTTDEGRGLDTDHQGNPTLSYSRLEDHCETVQRQVDDLESVLQHFNIYIKLREPSGMGWDDPAQKFSTTEDVWARLIAAIQPRGLRKLIW